MTGYDFMFKVILRTKDGIQGFIDIQDPAGLMGFKACMGVITALVMPVLLSRWNLRSKVGTGLLFIPLYLSKASICMLGGIVGVLFVLWFKMSSKKIWLAIVLTLCVLGGLFVKFIDMPMAMMPTRLFQWQMTLRDCIVHPVTGWGLDSFARETAWKPFVYAMNPGLNSTGGMHVDHWDNCHNLYVQTMYEWGLVGLLILVGYVRGCFLRFSKAIKDPNTVAMGAFLVVLLIVNIAQFPMFLSRTACFIIPIMALFEIQTGD
jgi:O-antigen ligase